MSKTLSIYACSGIGAAEQTDKVAFDYWLDNTQTVSNTQAVNTLLSRINLIAAEVAVLDMPDGERMDKLRMLDLYCAMLYYAQAYRDDAARLHDAGLAIGKVWANGAFDFDSMDNAARDLHLDEVIASVGEYLDADLNADPTVDAAIMEMWGELVEERNKVGLSVAEQNAVTDSLNSSKVSGVGAADYSINKDLASYLDRAGEYFLYTYLSDEDVKVLPKVFAAKRKTQQATYNYCKQMYVNVYGTEEEMRNVIRAGIIRDLGSAPEDVVKAFVGAYNTSVSGIGDPGLIAFCVFIISLIVGIAYLVTEVIKAIINACAKVSVAKYSTAAVENAEAATPTGDDYDAFSSLKEYQEKKEKKGSTGLLLLAAAAILLFVNKK